MNTNKNLTEATYIKVSQRKPAEKKRSKKVQRVVSTVVVVLVVAFLVMGGVDLLSNTANAYVVAVDGEDTVIMVSESEAEAALEQCLAEQSARTMDEHNYQVRYTNQVEIREVSAVGVVYSSISDASAALADELHLVAEAVVVYINENEALYVANETAAIEAVNLAKSHYATTQEEGVLRVYTTEQVSMAPATVECSQVLTAADAANKLVYGSLSPTDNPRPLITVNVEREAKEKAVLPYETVRVDNPNMTRGDEEVVTAGVDGEQELTLLLVESNGVVVSKEQVDAEVLTAPVSEVVEVGTKFIISSRGQNGSGEFGWPLAEGTGTITSRYGWRSRGWHSGLDIGNPVGTVLYASESGTVTYADYMSGGYGNIVIIDHGDGVETRYAHCAGIFVSVGDYVERGMSIAEIGMTGTTTGPHVHYEIRFDGATVDPLDYL